jgi:hypothetical protein
MTDSERLNLLETLIERTEYQNERRPKEYVKADMHFGGGFCSIYVRGLTGNLVQFGSGESVREAIDNLSAKEIKWNE